MTYKVGAKGQIVIPKPVRDELGIRPGDHVTVEAVNGEARVRRTVPLEQLRGMFRDGPGTAELEAERRREREREDRKVAAFIEGRYP